MKRLLILLLLGIGMISSILFANTIVPESSLKIIAEEIYNDALSKYSSSNSDEEVNAYINEYRKEILMSFKSVNGLNLKTGRLDKLGYVQHIKGSQNEFWNGKFTIFPERIEIDIDDFRSKNSSITLRFTRDQYSIGHAGESILIQFNNNDGVLIPIDQYNFLSLIDFLSYGRGYVFISFVDAPQYASNGPLKLDIYYFDLLYCSLWMNNSILPDKGWRI